MRRCMSCTCSQPDVIPYDGKYGSVLHDWQICGSVELYALIARGRVTASEMLSHDTA